MIQKYEYKVIPAPTKGRKGPGAKGPQGRFAHGVETAINQLAVEGWEYLRADILPSEERQGLTSSQTVYRSLLVFRRPLDLETVEIPAPLPPEDDTAEAVESDTTDEDAPETYAEAADETPWETQDDKPPFTPHTTRD